ncbi:Protein of unknown function [Oceanobacillus limi]|uniref:DUF1189 domain-containing protein n=1 Tax=Oceanobacillus limi TaxID=930131 RepID=A0A1I0CYH8_9BACI|nr:DUF1189 family protein [Oceanobacillus limi]SET24926.1 Protein of unknown function [Oceanobacillus limi]
MILWRTFLQSLQIPSKKIIFKLNRTGMDTTVFYMFILLFIVSTPSLIDRINENTGFTSEMNIVFLFIYFFIFSYLPLTITIFVGITIISYAMTWIAQLMERKLHLQVLWKMAAYTSTIPFLLYTVFELFYSAPDVLLWFSLVYIVVMLIIIISVYPKKRRG